MIPDHLIDAVAPVAQGAALGTIALLILLVVLIPLDADRWGVFRNTFSRAAIFLAFPISGALVAYAVVIGW